MPLTGSAGDAVLFDRRIWHSASTNTSSVTRVMAFYGCSYRWLRPKSAMQVDLGAVIDAIEHRLLGWATTPNWYFDLGDDDVPLRTWWEQHAGVPA